MFFTEAGTMNIRATLTLMLLICIGSGSSVIADCPSADLTGDCFVNFEDLAIIGAQFLNGYDWNDVNTLSNQWLIEGVPTDPCIMVWVDVNDSGAGMKDDDGNPISHGGFTGYMSKYETTNAQYCQFLNSALDAGMIRVDIYTDDANDVNSVVFNVVYATDDTSHTEPYFVTYPSHPLQSDYIQRRHL